MAHPVDRNTFKEWKDPVVETDTTECKNSSQDIVTSQSKTNIQSTLNPKNQHSKPETSKLINDQTSTLGPQVVRFLVPGKTRTT